MAITEPSRHKLYQRLEAVRGAEEAGTLMEHLPPVGWASVATKDDLARQDGRVDARFAQVDAWFAQVDARFAQVDARFDRIEEVMTARFDAIDARFEAMGVGSTRRTPTCGPTSTGRCARTWSSRSVSSDPSPPW